MKLYNTLTKQTETIQPISAPRVTVYTCGPTVYDYPHIGNWFTFIRYDVLIRTLKLSGLEPSWVMNITDVGHLASDGDEGEDKLEKGARREGKTAWDIAKFYGNYFVDGLKRLNFSQPDYLPKATEHIQEQIGLAQKLESKGFTYTISDGVYFDTAKFPAYGDFAQLDLDEQQAGARIEVNPEKRQPTDFALWKFSPAGRQRDMEWDSPWGKGFPGWHLECSAMSMKYLGKTIDIHSGGIDHVPVHHTNEIAQSQAVTGKPLANHWMHTNHITVDGAKIAKSSGNGITLEDIEAKGYSLAAFRLHVLESHYRSQSKFSWDSLAAATQRLQTYQALADLRWQNVPGELTDDYIRLLSEQLPTQITETLQDDLNTPQALSILSTLEPALTQGYASSGRQLLMDFLAFIDETLGLNLRSSQDISDVQKSLIAERETARQAQDWTRSDQLRDQLAHDDVGVRDTDRGAIWYRL